MKEQWKPVVCYEGLYEVSNLGNVKSLAREVVGYAGSTYLTQERILKPAGDRYLKVVLSKCGNKKTYTVHTIVVEAFLGPKPAGGDYTVDHINRDKRDNRVENLRWAIRFEQAENRDYTSVSHSGNVTLVHKETNTIVEYYEGFCSDYELKSGDIHRVIRGERRSSKGWYLLSD